MSHGRWSFSSDSRDCSEVRIAVELKDSWKVDMTCLDLQHFCRKFVELLGALTHQRTFQTLPIRKDPWAAVGRFRAGRGASTPPPST